MNPKYPVYIISKGRWKLRSTSKALERMKVAYHIVVEPQEYDRYARVISKDRILILPFSNLGQGSIPARNWVWNHALERKTKRHWILDDNMGAFGRINRNLRVKVESGTIFRCVEDFVDRYENVVFSGLNYRFFCNAKEALPAYYLNTRVYSCILIQNDIDFRWRGRYNEDTDLSIRILKAGYCTILFNAFYCDKLGTMIAKGGNEELYKDDGRKKMAQSLVDQHPDIVTVTWKWGRYQHQVDYRDFAKNRLIRISDYDKIVKDRINNYGMILVDIKSGKRLDI